MFKKKSVGFFVLCLILLGSCKSSTTSESLIQPTHRPTALPTAAPATATLTALPTVATVEPTITPTATRLPHDIIGIGTVWPPVVDTGLFYGEPCSPPCWEGITPGVTTLTESLLIFDQLKRQGRIASYTKITDWFYSAQLTHGRTELHLDEQGYVTTISLRYQHLRGFDFRVREIIDRFGEPEAYAPATNEFDRDDTSCENWDDMTAYRYLPEGALLLYPSQGLTIIIAVPEEYYGYVCPEMRATVFDYYQPRSLTNVLQEGYRPAFAGNNVTNEELVPWHGYGPGY